MITRAGVEPLALAEQAMEAGDADVVQPVDLVAHQLGGAGRLFGDRQVRRAGRRDEDRALARRDVLLRKAMMRCIGVVRRAPARRARTASNAASLARVTSSVDPRATISAAMAAIWAGVLPRPRTTSGNPCRMARW